MRRLDLDLAPRRGRTAGWVLLGLALVALLDLGSAWHRLAGEIDAAGRGGDGSSVLRAEAAGEATEAMLREAEHVARSLTLPWDPLFTSLEEAADEGVALLALQPDPQKRQIAISGEARDYAAILAFVARLDARRTLRDVHLVRHELREDHPQRPTSFSIVASWEPLT